MSSLLVNFISAQGFEGYYQYPDVHGDKIVFSAEGDLWTVVGVAIEDANIWNLPQVPLFVLTATKRGLSAIDSSNRDNCSRKELHLDLLYCTIVMF